MLYAHVAGDIIVFNMQLGSIKAAERISCLVYIPPIFKDVLKVMVRHDVPHPMMVAYIELCIRNYVDRKEFTGTS